MYYCALSLGVLQHTLQISCQHPENISLPPQKSFKSPEQTQHYGNNPNPSRKNPKRCMLLNMLGGRYLCLISMMKEIIRNGRS